MVWDGKPYYDHPPMGFWLMAITYGVFGISEFTTRLPSAVAGLLSIVLMYATGVRLFKRREVGFAAALILATSVWYVLRVRSGNLDSLFIFFNILTVYCSLRASEKFVWFPAAMAAFACLLLTKTLVGASAGAIILYAVFPYLFKPKKNLRYIIIGVVVFILILLPWYYSSYKTYYDFIPHHFLEIGTRSKSLLSYFQLKAEQPLFYLHMGVRKWYYLWILGIVSLIATLSFRRWETRFIILWNIVILYPFLTSSETQLWHLIPVYLPMAFISAYGLYKLETVSADLAYRYVFKRFRWGKLFVNKNLLSLLYIAAFSYLAFVQIKIFYPEVITPYKYVGDEVQISRSVSKYDKNIFLDDDYLPVAVYYSDRQIYPMSELPMFDGSVGKNTLVGLFESNQRDFVVITRSWALENLNASKLPYKVLEHNNSFTILTRP
ncbi:MAG: hypothetical protein RI947_30 [Candidatus Parcubacteria bacterium]